jgi:hypothetical protein
MRRRERKKQTGRKEESRRECHRISLFLSLVRSKEPERRKRRKLAGLPQMANRNAFSGDILLSAEFESDRETERPVSQESST